MALTPEQRARMEASKAQALAKRRAPPPLVPSPNPPPQAGLSSMAAVVLSGRKLVGSCMLLPHRRFRVKIGFHDTLIQIFKTLPSGAYNAQDRTWHFDLSDHDRLISQVQPLRPQVQVDPLPKCVIQTFTRPAPSIESETEAEELTQRLEPTLEQGLMPFQKAGVAFALRRQGRVYIADDMGLGKTVQALAVASAYRSEWPLLIVCPSSVRFSWRDALLRWIPSVPEEDVTVITTGKDFLCNGQAVVISYDLMSRKEKELIDRQFAVVIMDEAHFLKNYKSNRFQSTEKIVKKARRLILLSGTPALSRPIELYSQISLVMPKLFPYAVEFGMRYCNGKKITLPRGSHYDFNGSSNMDELKMLLEETCMIRRLKSEVLAQLPSKQREMILLDPSLIKSKSKEMEMQAQKMGLKSLSQMERRGVLLEWFNSTAKAKLKAVSEYVKDLLESDRKFICFAHHQIMMDNIAEVLVKRKTRFIRIDGNTSSEARNKHCDQFQRDDRTKVALLSITAANAGLTLTAAHLVVFAELFWNPGILTQAEDRAHRIGQSDSVTIQYLVAKGTADDELWPLLQKKLDVLNKAGLSKDNFHESSALQHVKKADEEANASICSPSKITDYFSTSLNELDLSDWDPKELEEDDENDPNEPCNSKKPKWSNGT
ncbi:hypothetical protein TCAL_00987 [Tigriopus californicus]|uniref:SWI/SNF-related matrix-associated actin-dependent regulator of chromatin subfamily A-like protein 1 n=2 Tax=Tigriopus californicus TaxID=6832 RepID=A0A553P4Z2_TIGCA|nr:hypothetical protein TCAL_00987 [Tigriopus californicus]|eukprot:TCALIF_00987-PA protein Name:"Similar to Smarcal1 SWI/SNF-related matrix-associated actin-dependent regulator of chromatin subfamily A-like protein 1 (Mus musculus)" AED:0.03 eAED:0.03 QI:160/1/0.83/1/1/1/6/2016/656